MNPLFGFLSLAYISCIFLMADSRLVSALSYFNPLSLLHIPLYGVLTVLLHLSFWEKSEIQLAVWRIVSWVKSNRASVGSTPTGQDCMEERTGERRGRKAWPGFLTAVLAFGVGIADEIHQSRIPGREASITDLLLDGVGIALACLLLTWLRKREIS